MAAKVGRNDAGLWADMLRRLPGAAAERERLGCRLVALVRRARATVLNGFLTWLIHGGAVARRVNTEKMLRALLVAGEPLSGYPLAKAARISGGAVYVALVALERDESVTSRWEILPEGVVRPRRRYYQLTDAGVVRARELLDGTAGVAESAT